MLRLTISSLLFALIWASSLLAEDDNYQELNWEVLIPASIIKAIENASAMPPPAPTEGSLEDRIRSNLDNIAPPSNPEDPFERALHSTEVVQKYDGKKVRLPGFVVPLEFNQKQQVTVFFLVPYFGACIHLPPPPPNQIIYIEYPQGLTQQSLQTPYWAEGQLHVDLHEDRFTKSAYSMTLHSITLYDD